MGPVPPNLPFAATFIELEITPIRFELREGGGKQKGGGDGAV